MKVVVWLGLVVGLVGGLAPAAQAQKLKFATLAPQGSTWMNAFDRAALKVETDTNKRVGIQYYANGVAGDEATVVLKLKSGALDGASLTLVGLAQIDPHISVLELPMLFQDETEMEYAVARLWPYFQKRFLAKGYILGPYAKIGGLRLLTSAPVTSVADLQALRVWEWDGSDALRLLFADLNLNTVPMGIGQVQSALTTGKVNASFASPLAAIALQWHTQIQFMSSLTLSYSIGATVVTKQAWDQASHADQIAMETIAKSAAQVLNRDVRLGNIRAEQYLTKNGVLLVRSPSALTNQFRTSARRVWAALSGASFSAAELKLIKKYIAAYRTTATSGNGGASGSGTSASNGGTSAGGSGVSGSGSSSTGSSGTSDDLDDTANDYDYDD